jgi:hypothetical protein
MLQQHEVQHKEGFSMKKIITMLVVFMFILTGNLIATPVTLENTITFSSAGATSSGDGTGRLISYGYGSVNKLDGCFDYVKWSQTFTFNPPAETDSITGKLHLSLRDDGGRCDGFEFGLGWTNTGQVFFEEVNTQEYDYNVALDNGQLIVTLASLGGDFYIDSARLGVNYNPAPVPEPASLLLLGVGLLSVGIFTRKRNKNS